MVLGATMHLLSSKNIKNKRNTFQAGPSFFQSLLFWKGQEKKQKIDFSIRQITGIRPRNIKIYSLALKHTSAAFKNELRGFKESNERLEYLGDAILGAVVADYLFKKFPYKDEGFLTEIRSRIVNRESLNNLCKKIGLSKLIEYENKSYLNAPGQSIYGDALEALVGAVYLDRGFKSSKKFIIQKLLPYYDLSTVVSVNLNFKSLLIEWSQKEGKQLIFEIIEEKGKRHQKEFTAQVIIDGGPLAMGYGFSKKKAEQSAAQKACELLEIK